MATNTTSNVPNFAEIPASRGVQARLGLKAGRRDVVTSDPTQPPSTKAAARQLFETRAAGLAPVDATASEPPRISDVPIHRLDRAAIPPTGLDSDANDSD